MQFAIALIIVLALMGLLGILMKKMNAFQSGIGGRNNRLQIIEQRIIDSKSKAVIIRCDDKDHLVVIGQQAQIVVKADMDKPPMISKKDIPVESL
jgi:flagellar protein FliO/FliZ